MTVAEIKKEKKYGLLTIFLFSLILFSLATFIFTYKNIITLRHDINKNNKTLIQEEVKNADLKTSIYKITDNIYQEPFLIENGLVLDRNPYYVESTVEVSYLTR